MKASLAKLRHPIDAQELADEHAELERNAELKDLVEALFSDFEQDLSKKNTECHSWKWLRFYLKISM